MGKKLKTTEEFIADAINVHGNKYDYSKSDYINRGTKLTIICPDHGEFQQTPHDHLSGCGCKLCGRKRTIDSKRYTTESFVEKAKIVHGDTYDYGKTNYTYNRTPVIITCKIHGDYQILPNYHIQGSGCPKCGFERFLQSKLSNTEDFIKSAREIHGDKYDYRKVQYKKNTEPVCIICPKHGEFWQKPNYHLSGNGCPKCSYSHMESDIEQLLKENNIKYIGQYRDTWLNRQSLDFYIPDYKIAIECQGIQHFEIIQHYGGEEKLSKTVHLDEQKRQLCLQHGIQIIYYANYNYNFPYKVLTNKDELLSTIVNKS